MVRNGSTISGIMYCIPHTIPVLNKPYIVVYNKNSDRADVRIKLLGFTTFKNPITGLSSHCAQCLVNGHVMNVLDYQSQQNNQKTVYINAPNDDLLQLQLPSTIGQETTATIFNTKKYSAKKNDDGKNEVVAIQKPTPGTPGYVPIIPVVQPTIPVKNKLQPNNYSILLSQQVTNDYNNNKPPFYDPNISNISTTMPTTTYVEQGNIVTNMNAINTNNQAASQSLQNTVGSPILNTAPTFDVVTAEPVPAVNPGVTNITNTNTGRVMQAYDAAENTTSYIYPSNVNPLSSVQSADDTQTVIPVNQLQSTSVSTTALAPAQTTTLTPAQTTSVVQSAYTPQNIANTFLSSDANTIDSLFRNAQNDALNLAGTTYTNTYNYNSVPITTTSPMYNTGFSSINMEAPSLN